MPDLWRDIRYGIRSIIRNPPFAFIATVALAIGIASTTSVFSVVNAVVLEPLPYTQSDALVHVGTAMTDGRTTSGGLSPFALARLREQSSHFAGFAGAFRFEVAIQDRSGRPLKTEAYVVTEGFFDVFGARMSVGRGFVPEEHVANTGSGFVVLSHRLWRNAFSGDPAIAGSSVMAGAGSFTVVGVAGPDFDYPAGADLWVAFDPDDRMTAFFLDGVARLSDGSSLGQGRTELGMLASRFEEESTSFRARTLEATDLKEWIVGDTRQTLVILLGAAATLLLISCANVMTLLLARGESRSREIALRAALGAGRWSLVQQLIAESLTLAATGALVGLLATFASLKVLSRIGPAELPRLAEVGIDGNVLIFTIAVTGATGLLFGLVPAVRLIATDIRSLMGGGTRGTAGSRTGTRIFNALVFAQSALAATLLIAAGVLLRSFDRVRHADGGFDPGSVLVMDVNLPQPVHPDYDDVGSMYETLLERVRDIPGVAAAGAGSSVPLGPTGGTTISQYVVGLDNWDEPPRAEVRSVGPGHLEAMGIRIVEGRGVSGDDRPEGPGIAVVNERYVSQILQGRPALGQRIRFSVAAIRTPENPVAWQRLEDWEIVGVANDVKYESLTVPPVPTVYVPHTQFTTRRILVAVRTDGRAPTEVTNELRGLVRDMDPTVPADFTSMDTLISASLGTERMVVVLLLAFGLSATVLAAVGTWGVIALSVERRIPEMAIRASLGAGPSRVLWHAISTGLATGLAGILAGTGVALLARRVLASQVYEVSPTDPLAMVGAPLLLGLVALIAVLVPALRTRRINLSATLRAEH